MENILEIRDLSKKYENFELNNINLSLPKGTIMGFVGENGAGKTTTISLILNMIHRDSGTINLDWIIKSMNRKSKNRLALCWRRAFSALPCGIGMLRLSCGGFTAIGMTHSLKVIWKSLLCRKRR